MSASAEEEWLIQHPAVASQFTTGLQQGRLYDSLDVDPACSDAALLERIDRDISTLEHLHGSASGALAKRASGAIRALERLRALLGDRRWRTEYDFRHGFTRAAERIAAAERGDGLSLDELQRIWARVHPHRVARANALMHRGTDEGLRAAASLDPFHPKLAPLVVGDTAGDGDGDDDAPPPPVGEGSVESDLPARPSEWEQPTPQKRLIWEGEEVRWEDVTPLVELYSALPRQPTAIVDEPPPLEAAVQVITASTTRVTAMLAEAVESARRSEQQLTAASLALRASAVRQPPSTTVAIAERAPTRVRLVVIALLALAIGAAAGFAGASARGGLLEVLHGAAAPAQQERR